MPARRAALHHHPFVVYMPFLRMLPDIFYGIGKLRKLYGIFFTHSIAKHRRMAAHGEELQRFALPLPHRNVIVPAARAEYHHRAALYQHVRGIILQI